MKETPIISLEALRTAMTKTEATTFTTSNGGEFKLTPKFCETLVTTVVKCSSSTNKPLVSMMGSNPNAVKKLIALAKKPDSTQEDNAERKK